MEVNMKSSDERAIFAFMAVIALLGFATATVAAQSLFEVESIDVTVYRDGVVHVTQTLTVDELAPEITVALLSSSIENMLVVDENQRVVDYEISVADLTVFTLGAEHVVIEYDTIALTSKEAEVWTLIADNPYTTSVFLPRNSTVIYLNMMPTAIDTSGTGIKLSLYPGQWEISYVVPLSEDGTDGNGASGPTIPIDYLIAAIVAVVAVIISVILIIRRRKASNVKKTVKAHPQLKKEDKEVIEFLAEKGGQAFEAEIRERFPDMPRTSLWRLVRRLERLEIVEVKKIGLENQVKLKQ
jgi:uncharacterized membrane protein